jgi:DNA-binding Xre family transcriptional regulator
MAERRSIATADQLHKALGISPTGAVLLFRDNFELIGRVALDNLCRALRCRPGQLITDIPDVE